MPRRHWLNGKSASAQLSAFSNCGQPAVRAVAITPCRSHNPVSPRTEPYAELRILTPGSSRSSVAGAPIKNRHAAQRVAPLATPLKRSGMRHFALVCCLSISFSETGIHLSESLMDACPITAKDDHRQDVAENDIDADADGKGPECFPANDVQIAKPRGQADTEKTEDEGPGAKRY